MTLKLFLVSQIRRWITLEVPSSSLDLFASANSSGFFFTLIHSEASLIANSINLSLMHPRLFISVILHNPILQLSPKRTVLGTNAAGMLDAVTYLPLRSLAISRSSCQILPGLYSM